ncbi:MULTISPECIES: MerR family transcriptional regulator [unclassified Streptomyces]|uniref:MerR family transcriptional regulator n=1 Tax=unclassified Streptomyces TaxID=2593676 RepID=UPI00093FB84E|nr:MerR family transcriptional regulator [Streptomyces sp. CB01249]OKI92036.1 MerR family transcriptional regulator [Streptomyces sp. CB01249]
MQGATGQRPIDLTIQEMARRSGFSESALRYYEKVGLLGPVARDDSSGHRRYGPETAARIEALSCLRSAGVTVSGMRRYLDLLARGEDAAVELRDLFASQAERLADDIEQRKLRLAYLRSKADLWDARVRRDGPAEERAVKDTTRLLEHFFS